MTAALAHNDGGDSDGGEELSWCDRCGRTDVWPDQVAGYYIDGTDKKKMTYLCDTCEGAVAAAEQVIGEMRDTLRDVTWPIDGSNAVTAGVT